jgi:4-amino-4-deoxy-L-arabinose transferase-like glycosyltransferase
VSADSSADSSALPGAGDGRSLRGSPNSPRSKWGALLVLFLFALAVRVAALQIWAPHRAAEGSSAWDIGHEAACLAQSLAEGRGFGDPWGKDTGASSWLTPPYPALLAGLMKVFGGVTPATFWALFLLQSLASAATCALIVRIGSALEWRRAGWVAGALFALYPPAVWNAVHVVWDSTFAAFALAWFLAALLEPGRASTRRGAVELGLGYGALLFLNPAPIVIAPVVLGFLWLERESWRAGVQACAVFTGCAALVCAPWMIRNLRVLGTPALRPNFGVELRVGNNPTSNGHPQPVKYHPSHVPEELELYRKLGERDYSADCARRAAEWIRSDPAAFAVLTLRRVQYFWIGDPPFLDERRTSRIAPGFDFNSWSKFLTYAAVGLGALVAALRLDLAGPRKLLILGTLLLFGAPYYVSHVSERYRFPLDPLIALLDCWLLLRLWSLWAAGRGGRPAGP